MSCKNCAKKVKKEEPPKNKKPRNVKDIVDEIKRRIDPYNKCENCE